MKNVLYSLLLTFLVAGAVQAQDSTMADKGKKMSKKTKSSMIKADKKMKKEDKKMKTN